MDLVSLADAPPHDPDRFVAVPILEGAKGNARVIRLSSGQALPAHTHEPSELMLYVVEGAAELGTDDGPVPFVAGTLARFDGEEELRVSNPGAAPVTLLAFLTPPFPPR
jgi:quercetin dioxygenase-like cupin family protein